MLNIDEIVRLLTADRKGELVEGWIIGADDGAGHGRGLFVVPTWFCISGIVLVLYSVSKRVYCVKCHR